MRSRHRSKSQWRAVGSITTVADGHSDLVSENYDEKYMDDVTEKKKDKTSRLLPATDLEIDHIERISPTLSSKGKGFYWTHRNVPMAPQYYPINNHWQSRYYRDMSENPYYAVKTIAATHPFRSEFSVPTAIAEMLDIGTLFKLTAKGFADLVGSSYLQYKFGWVQFVNDIKTLATITRSIERRIKEFDSLGKKGGLRRKVDLDHTSWSDNGQQGFIYTLYGVYVVADWHRNQTNKVWGTIRWRWKPGILVSLSKLEAFNLAVQTVFDLGELDASTIWNTIPWTWLADYFIDIGSWLQASENADIVEFFDLCICREYKNITDLDPALFDVSQNQYYSVNRGRMIRTQISRDVIRSLPALPPLRYSFLSKSQVLVLLALYGKFRGSSY